MMSCIAKLSHFEWYGFRVTDHDPQTNLKLGITDVGSRDGPNQLVAHGLKIDRGYDQFDLGKHGQIFHQRFKQVLYTLP